MDLKKDEHIVKKQRITVIEQNGRSEKKISGILKYGNGHFEVAVHTITARLPEIIDDGRQYLPKLRSSELVLDYLNHPDLSYDLAILCNQKNIPVVASGKKITVGGIWIPPVCCALPSTSRLGLYGRRFGLPKFDIVMTAGMITNIYVKRGAPCGATWNAARKVIGMSAGDAAVQIGLETQFFCSADPAGWDPIHGKSPVHLAGHLHRAAFLQAISSTDHVRSERAK